MKTTLIALATAITALPASACESYDAVVAAVHADDAAEAARLYEDVAVSAECDDALREWVGDYLARVSFAKAMSAAGTPAEKRAALERALGYERHWRSFDALAGLDWAAGDYDSAAMHYQLALQELVEGDPEHAATEAEIATLYDMASAAVALAGDPAIPTSRSGAPGGIFASRIRGFEVMEIPLPITFEYDSAVFDAQGVRFAEALVEYVHAIEPGAVSLTGHTDPRGTEEYNEKLSLARAAAVEALLRGEGFAGDIRVDGHGEADLPPAPPGIAPGSDEHFRLARRVVFRIE